MIAHAATWASAIACAVLVAAERRHARRLRVGAKLAASAAFVTLGFVVDGGHPFGRPILAGLCLGAVGDLLLLGRGRRPFLAGLVAFLAGHLAYVVAFARLVPPGEWLGAAGAYAALPAAAAIAVVARLWPNLGSLRGPVIAYAATIAAMVVGAIAVRRADALPPPEGTYLAAGAALFFASDLAVARDRFAAATFANKLWGLPAYYAGQLLIAWSIAG